MATKKGLGSFIKGLFGIADDVPTPKVDSDKIKKIDDFTSGYDKSTKPGAVSYTHLTLPTIYSV